MPISRSVSQWLLGSQSGCLQATDNPKARCRTDEQILSMNKGGGGDLYVHSIMELVSTVLDVRDDGELDECETQIVLSPFLQAYLRL